MKKISLLIIAALFVTSLLVTEALAATVVEFAASASSGSESATSVNLAVKLNAASTQTVTVSYAATGGFASYLNEGTGQDYILSSGVLTFTPGQATKNIILTIVDDSINEVDETIGVLLSNPTNATLGANTMHTYTIIDNDRAVLKSVKDYGAEGNGTTDDTAAIQAAIDDVYSKGGGSTGKGGVLTFPAGIYLVTSVSIKDNITYQGYGATIKRPDYLTDQIGQEAAQWTRTFTNGPSYYSGSSDSKPLIVKGLTFDGSSQTQGPYHDYELNQATQLFLGGYNSETGRLKAYVEDCYFKDSVGFGGIAAHQDVDITVYNVTTKDIFVGSFLTRGENDYNCRIRLKNLTSIGSIDPNGIYMESGDDDTGTKPSQIYLNDINLVGEFTIGVEAGTIVQGDNIIVSGGPLRLSANDADMSFTNSKFNIGWVDSTIGTDNDHISPPGNNLLFDNCEFNFSEKETPEKNRSISLPVEFQIWPLGAPTWVDVKNQKSTFNNCRFKTDNSIENADTLTAIEINSSLQDVTNDNTVELNGCYISNSFDVGINVDAGVLSIKNTINQALTPLIKGPAVNYTNIPGSPPADTNPPIGNVLIANGDIITESNKVTLTLNALDANQATEMKISNINDFNSVTAEPYQTTKTWYLFPGRGTKNVYVWFKDSLGNWTEATKPKMDTIVVLSSTSSIIYGDVSGDGNLSAYDASLAAQYAVGSITLTAEQITKADVSGDGTVSAYDASLIAQYAVGLISKFPVEG